MVFQSSYRPANLADEPSRGGLRNFSAEEFLELKEAFSYGILSVLEELIG